MRQELLVQNHVDESGNPTGGGIRGTGIHITWQNGPLGRDEERQAPNGAFVEDVLVAALKRLEFYQTSKFKCESNAKAIKGIEAALKALDERTREREARAVEGTHQE